MADNRPPAPQTPLPPGFLGRPFAHRGLHDPQGGAVENSLPAIEAACAAGYGIEMDLQLSADGVAMVFHDDDLARLTHEDGPVRARPATGLQAMALEGGDGATIPTLAEALALVRGRAPLLIELKDQSGDLTATDGLLEDATLRALDGYTGSLALMSFNPHMVAHLGRQAPQYPRGLTTDAFQRAHWPQVPPATRTHLSALGDLGRVGASFISHNHHSLDTPPVAEARAKGLNVLTWTIRSTMAEAVARKWADAITFEGYLP